MKDKLNKLIFALLCFLSLNSFAAESNTTDPYLNDPTNPNFDESLYNFVYGDFNGEGNYDILYMAKNPNDSNGQRGILSWTSDCEPPQQCLTVLQIWDNDHLGITWNEIENYKVQVNDFNGDGRMDLFLDHSADGSNYILLANASGNFETPPQIIQNNFLNLDWGNSNIVFGDFNKDDRIDIYLQPVDADTSSYVLLANAQGVFTEISDSWDNEHLGILWSQNDGAIVEGVKRFGLFGTVIDTNPGNLDITTTVLPEDEATTRNSAAETEKQYVMIKYKNYKIPVPVQKSNGQNDVDVSDVSTRQHQNPTVTGNITEPVRLSVIVYSDDEGKFSEGNLLVLDPTEEVGEGASGKSHCRAVPQLCNSR